MGLESEFSNNDIFISKFLILASSVDHDEMPLFVVFHLGLNCLTFNSSRYPLNSSQYKKGYPAIF